MIRTASRAEVACSPTSSVSSLQRIVRPFGSHFPGAQLLAIVTW